MKGKKQALMTAKIRYVPQGMWEVMMGVIMTMRKLKSQLEQVETALALARVFIGETSAGTLHRRRRLGQRPSNLDPGGAPRRRPARGDHASSGPVGRRTA